MTRPKEHNRLKRVRPEWGLAERFAFYVQKGDGCWEWRGPKTSLGYGKLCFNYKYLGAHRVSWELHRGPIGAGLFLCHKCDNPGCVNPDHLFLGTQMDNMRDKIAKGRDLYGEKNTEAKLKECQVREILRDTRSLKEIAADYDVSGTMIGFIKNGRKWKHVSREMAHG